MRVSVLSSPRRLSLRRRILRRFRRRGTRLNGGFPVHYASTLTKGHGTPTRVTVTSAECSSYSVRGVASEGSSVQIWHRRVNSYGAPIWYGVGTGVPGGSGERREPAGSGDA